MRRPPAGAGELGLPEGQCVPLPQRKGRGGVVAFDDRGFQRADRLWNRPQVPAPDEAAMEAEEGDGADGRQTVEKGWVLLEVLEWVFRDAEPGDWRRAGRRLGALAKAVAPGLGWRADGVACGPCAGAGAGGGGLGDLRCVREACWAAVAARLVEWLFAPRQGARRLKDAAARAYLLARAVRPEALRLAGDDGRAREMTLEEMGVAFGEGRGGRARWHYRARTFLEGLPKAAWQRGETTREKCRDAQRGNHNRIYNNKNRNRKHI